MQFVIKGQKVKDTDQLNKDGLSRPTQPTLRDEECQTENVFEKLRQILRENS